jgi:predicted outer membrane repeat protein
MSRNLHESGTEGTQLSVRRSVIVWLLSVLNFTVLTADEAKWIAVGDLHSWYSSAGSEREVGRTGHVSDQQDGLRWPALYRWQDTQAAKALWIGTTDYYDPLVDQTFDYKVVHVGPRVLNEDEFIPVEFKLVGRFDHPQVFVNDYPGSDLMIGLDEVDEIDPTLPADRMLYNVVHTGLGITMTRKIYAFTNPYHDNYFIYDYVFKNTGICTSDSSITHSQTLTDVIFFFQYRYAPTREAGAYGYFWLPQSATWGHATVNDVILEHPVTGDPFRAHFAWLGLHSQSMFNTIGGPNGYGDGRLGAAQYVGAITLHADSSAANSGDDPDQPFTTDFMNSDLAITGGNSQFDAEQMAQEYAVMAAGRPALSHAQDMGCPTPIDCSAYADLYIKAGDWANVGGYSQTQGFGPYTLAPGDSIHLVLAEGVAGLRRALAAQIGAEWLNGTAPFTLPDGSTTDDADTFKNAWVYTGQDSLFRTFERALANYQSGFAIPQPPPPPATFEVFATDHITLVWDDNAEAWPNFAGYKIFRAVDNPDTVFQEIFACGAGTEHPEIVNSYQDTDVILGRDYYYYIVSFDDGSTNDSQPGVPLTSSKFWTRTRYPAQIQSGVDADLYVAPDGSDDNSGLNPEEPLQTITAALERILATSLFPRTIHLAAGIYSPTTNGESYPLSCQRYVTLSGAGANQTILDADGSGTVIHCPSGDGVGIENLTIQNGAGVDGGGIYFHTASGAHLTDIVVRDNSASGAGGGIWLGSGNLALSNVTVKQNSAGTYGGGMYLEGQAVFATENRSNLFLNTAGIVGYDVYRNNDFTTELWLDTFTVQYPTDYYAYPAEAFSFHILNHLREQVLADLYVSPLGDDANSGLTPADPLKTITRALVNIVADSLNPRTIHLAGGVYSSSATGETYPLFCRSHVSFLGAGSDSTVLDGEGNTRIFYSARDSSFAIGSMTIRHGYTYDGGGGLYCDRSHLALWEVVFQDNSTVGQGGAILTRQSRLTAADLILRNNSAAVGGGLAGSDLSTLILTGGVISGNTAAMGGGLALRQSEGILSDLTIHGNQASQWGGGIECAQVSGLTLSGVTVRNNTAAVRGGGIYFGPNVSVSFDSTDRSSIFLNTAANNGTELFAESPSAVIDVVVDTFTVLYPTEIYAFPREAFTFDVLNYLVEQVLADLYVSPAGDDANSGLTPDDPLRTITTALTRIYADSLTPRTIHLAEGIYSPSTNGETFPLMAREYVTIAGASQVSTILDAERQSNIIVFTAIQQAEIRHLTIRNGVAVAGGGIYCEYSSPVLEQVLIIRNTAESGGGLYCLNASPILRGVTIRADTASAHGGGICVMEQSRPVLQNVLLTGNSAYRGGGMYSHASSPIIRHTLVSENFAYWGGGLFGEFSRPLLVNVTLGGNAVSQFGSALAYRSDSHPVVINSIVWNNPWPEIVFLSGNGRNTIAIAHSDVSGGEGAIVGSDIEAVYWLEGNLDADPLFVGGEPLDYQLSEGSPCVDAGIAFYVWEGDTVITLPDTAFHGNAPDMGAFESAYTAGVDNPALFPKEFALYPNYPNPFNPVTVLRYALPVESRVRLVVYDLLGREVRTLVQELQPPGYHSVSWYGRDNGGRPVSAGIYLYRIQAGAFVKTRKMLMLK